MTEANRKQRRAAKKEGHLDTAAFLDTANKFIDLANRSNENVLATELHMAFLFASARYSAFVAKAIQNVENHEDFVSHMTRQYQEMLRQHLADDGLEPSSQG